jgi:hypothetical protein
MQLPLFKTRRAARVREARVSLLARELDVQGARSVERTRAIETKAAYLLTATTVVVAASISLLGSGLGAYFALCALAVSAGAIIFATRAIRLLVLDVPSAGQLVDAYVNSGLSAADLEDTLLEVRRREIENRDELNQSRTHSLKVAFKWLSASVVVVLLAAIISAIPINEGATDGEKGRSETSEATPAP